MTDPWKISYGGTGHEFGAVFVEQVQIGSIVYRVDDSAAPRMDGIYFGQDFADPGDIEITVAVEAAGVLDPDARRAFVAAEVAAFTKAWDAAEARLKPGALVELHAGEIGVFEGRPRGLEWDRTDYASGFLRGRARFIRDSLISYPPESEGGGWQQVTLGLVPSQVGGLIAPLIAPLRTSVESSRATPVVVAGDSDAWPVIELVGPIQSDAQVECVGRWSLRLNRGLSQGQTARLDTRDGRVATYLNDVPVQLLDPRSSLLSGCSLLPGSNVIALRGSSIEGTASVTVRWRNTRGAI